MNIYTIGHSAHPFNRFLSLLQSCNVTCLVDVRSAPYSRFHPQYNRQAIPSQLEAQGIRYVFLGEALGGRPKDPGLYLPAEEQPALPGMTSQTNLRLNYTALVQQGFFQEGIRQLVTIANQQVTAIMCSEEDPSRCHRHAILARFLCDNHPEIDVVHIRGNGSIYPYSRNE